MDPQPAVFHEVFFQKDPKDPDKSICNLCGHDLTIRDKTGFSSAKTHVTKRHRDKYQQVLALHKTNNAESNQLITQFFNGSGITEQAQREYGYLSTIVMNNLSFSTVENQYFRNLVKQDSISRKHLMKLLKATEIEVRKSIRQAIPEKFGVIFDGKFILLITTC